MFDIVLIETYWNVKENDLVFLKNSFAVLIETYWNVKRGIPNVQANSD